MTTSLIVNGIQHGGWKQINITLAMDNLAGGFQFELSEKWPTGQRDIKGGDECKVNVDGNILITGLVDEAMPQITDREHTLMVTGRDTSGQLVDCSAINKPGQWSGVKMDTIARGLCKPFGVGVTVATDIGKPFKKFNIQQGETAFDAINRMASLRGVLVYSDGNGNVIIGNRATKRTASPLILRPNDNNNNVKMARFRDSWNQRYSQVIVKGQTQGTATLDVDSTRGPKGTATDPNIRYRPLLVMAEGQANAQQCKEQAEWKLRTMRGKSEALEVDVAGWYQQNGRLWAINEIAFVDIPTHKLQKDMLITQVVFSLSEGGGTTTTLTLQPPESFDAIERPADAI